jgi:hypothetical protein
MTEVEPSLGMTPAGAIGEAAAKVSRAPKGVVRLAGGNPHESTLKSHS